MSTHVLRLIREDDAFRHDPYGAAMSWRFAIADFLHDHAHPVPDRWQYRRSPIHDPAHATAHEHLLLDLSFHAGDISFADLIHAGDVLARYVAMLTHFGRTY